MSMTLREKVKAENRRREEERNQVKEQKKRAEIDKMKEIILDTLSEILENCLEKYEDFGGTIHIALFGHVDNDVFHRLDEAAAELGFLKVDSELTLGEGSQEVQEMLTDFMTYLKNARNKMRDELRSECKRIVQCIEKLEYDDSTDELSGKITEIYVPSEVYELNGFGKEVVRQFFNTNYGLEFTDCKRGNWHFKV